MTDDEAFSEAVAGTESMGAGATYRYIFEAGKRQALAVQRSMSHDDAVAQAFATMNDPGSEARPGWHFFDRGAAWARAQTAERPGTPTDLEARATTYARHVNFDANHLDIDQVWAEGVLHGRATPSRVALPRSNPYAGLLDVLTGERATPAPQDAEIPLEYTAAPNRAAQARSIEGESEDDLFARALATWTQRSFSNHGDLVTDIARHAFDFARACTELPWEPLNRAPRENGRLYVLRNARGREQLRATGEDIRLARFSAMESEAGGRPDRWEFVSLPGFIDRSTVNNWQWLDTSRMGTRPPEPPPEGPSAPAELRSRGTRRMAI